MTIHALHRFKVAIQARPYFFISFALIAILYCIINISTNWQWSTTLLLSWNIAVVVYLILTMKALWGANRAHILKRAQQQDASKWLIIFLVILSMLMCFIAIVIELVHLPDIAIIKFGHLVLAISTIICAWLFMHTIFAIHYAHDFYLAVAKHQDGGLDFPKTPEPSYPDFIYFSYVCGTSAQTADVNITSSSMRVLNTLHILLAYMFNTTILAICINVAASFI